MIIAVINQKGGAGKTTLAVHLSCYLHDAGHRVALIDNDPQGSATKWIRLAEPGVTLRSVYEAKSLVGELEALDASHDVVIADGSPRLNEQTHVLMYFADRILIPTRPASLDLQATLETKGSIDKVAAARAADNRSALDIRLVLNFVRTVGNAHQTAREALRALDLPLAQHSLSTRDAYAQSVTNQTVVTRMTKGAGPIAAAQEITALFEEVLPHELRRQQIYREARVA